ncbi:MAG TPA: SDR family oxidoreductase [Acidimicrobiales bacterium]|nr:SDR family oxidoreductase [Acidimicrobiales bacterium]
MRFDFTGKVAVVTGASSGIGAATARLLASSGAALVLVGRDAGRLHEVAGTSPGAPDAVAVAVDLAQVGASDEVARAAADAFGSVDVVVHCAGLLEMAPVADVDPASIERMWAINARAPMLLTRSLAPHMGDGSAIVFVSSTVAHVGFGSYAPYSATKGALEAFARALAVELAPRTRVNVLAPGFVATPMLTDQYPGAPGLESWVVERTPLGFIGSGEDLATTILTLCDPESSRYVTGSTLVVDGGWIAKG